MSMTNTKETLYNTQPVVVIEPHTTAPRVSVSPCTYDPYSTLPVPIIHLQSTEEEVLYTSFEQAISDRLKTFHVRHAATRRTPSMRTATWHHRSHHMGLHWQRLVTLGCIAMMLILVGFDLMGLLILHAH